MTIAELKAKNIPSTPGVYFFKDKKGHILYIGKATSLKERLRSYFAADLIETRGPHILDMVFKAQTLTWEVCTNVLEALILETALIKQWKPYYNTKEKDDKSFNCVVITKEAFPQVLLVRARDIDFKKLQTTHYKLQTVYGPFPSGSAIKEGLRIMRRIFPFRDRVSIQKDKEIFYRQIGLTPDVSNVDAEKKYKETIHQIKLFLGGKFAELRRELTKKMKALAKLHHFEEAGEIKKKLFALDHISDVALLKRETAGIKYQAQNFPRSSASSPYQSAIFRVEAYDVAHISGKDMVGVMVALIDGNPDKNEYRKFNIRSVSKSNDPAALKETLTRRLGHTEWQLPNLIVVDGNEVQKNVAEAVLKEGGFNIDVVAVVKDDRHKARGLIGKAGLLEKYKLDILLANHEAHRFAIRFHRSKRVIKR